MRLEREMDAALAAAEAGAALVRAVYERGFSVEWKGQGDPITEADRRSNEHIVAALRAAFPGDAVCAEEADLRESSRQAARGGRCWFVDPLDGTREFVGRSGEFCVMVGLALDGRAALGAVVAPAWGRRFAGVVGEGAWELGAGGQRRPLRVTAGDGPPRVVLSRLHRNGEVERAAARLHATDLRACGSTGLKLLLVAAGEVDLYLHTGPGPSLWDGCAPEAIARAAGAEVTDAAGAPLRYDTAHLPLDRGIVAAAPALAARARAALRAVPG